MAESVFRKEALDRYAAGDGQLSDVVRTPRRWLSWCFLLVVGVACAGLCFVSLASIDVYAKGPAVIRAVGSTLLISPTTGQLRSLGTSIGKHVHQGDVLAEIGGTEPLDPVRASLRAPFEGTVSSVRLRERMPVGEGDVVLTLTPDPLRFHVQMAFPARYRPMLRAGLIARVELDGFPSRSAEARIESIAGGVISPPELQSLLGAEARVEGPFFIAEGSLTADSLTQGGQAPWLFDGLGGSALARVGRSKLLTALVPWTRAARESGAE